MAITLNSTTIPQPSTLEEDIIPIQTDVTGLDGSMQRNFMQNKYQATLTYTFVTPTDYATLLSIINTGLAVAYYNDYSAITGGALSFTALPTFTNSAYAPGSSNWQPLTVVIRQV